MDNTDDRDLIKVGDKILIQVIINKGKIGERIASESASFCFEINGHRCFFYNGSMISIDEALGSTLTRLDDVLHKDLINKHTVSCENKFFTSTVHSSFSINGFARVNGEMKEFFHYKDIAKKYVKPWSIINKKI